ncbi:glycosyltransferase family 31 protein [Daldinia caldariorum]|uniref:glycosyltransferase family 31 protein n=1 Tax=Daldinia caldariorum TaxID=326644 RepID=UPI0020086EA3|nr:glycosyltransferase family 31 protein [Daldinia caldariorum]KAI1471022.1 glycosyltransferase family 31 protein [Daldinia caldariorum]
MLSPTISYGSSCNHFPNTSDILVVVKTGATESYSKIPTQLITVLRCLPDFLIFSDMEQDIAGHHVRDSLDSVIDEAKERNSDFDLYRRQKACVIDQHSCNFKGKQNLKFEGWRLDKYKNVHIAEKTYHLRPNYDWYLFIDADTYVLWNNLAQWLRILGDPSKQHYVGSVALLNDFAFAHGGSGYVLSQATMRDLAVNHPGIANQYDMKATKSCCGDYVLGVALNETLGIGVKQAWPTINGEKPYTIPYGPREWCHPIDFEKRFYQSRGVPRPVMRFKDIFEEFVAPKFMARRDDWDNLSEDVLYLDPNRSGRYPKWQQDSAKKPHKQIRASAVEQDAYKSFEHCRKLCHSIHDCFQFSYRAGACTYNKSFRLGKPAPKTSTEEDRWVSGWNIERIRPWVEGQAPCGEPVWPKL